MENDMMNAYEKFHSVQSLQAGQTGTGSHHFEISAPARNPEICLLWHIPNPLKNSI